MLYVFETMGLALHDATEEGHGKSSRTLRQSEYEK